MSSRSLSILEVYDAGGDDTILDSCYVQLRSGWMMCRPRVILRIRLQRDCPGTHYISRRPTDHQRLQHAAPPVYERRQKKDVHVIVNRRVSL